MTRLTPLQLVPQVLIAPMERMEVELVGMEMLEVDSKVVEMEERAKEREVFEIERSKVLVIKVQEVENRTATRV